MAIPVFWLVSKMLFAVAGYKGKPTVHYKEKGAGKNAASRRQLTYCFR